MDKRHASRPSIDELRQALKLERQKRPSIAELEEALEQERELEAALGEQQQSGARRKQKKVKSPKPPKQSKEPKQKTETPPKEKQEKPPKAEKEKPPKPPRTPTPKKHAVAAAVVQESELPDVTLLEDAVQRNKKRHTFFFLLRNAVFALITVAAVSALVATLFMPVLRIYSSSMAPNLYEGEIVITMKQKDVSTGDIIAFYYNNKIFVKRVIAGPGETVDIDADGNVFIDGALLDEPYLERRSAGLSDIEYPYTVPEASYFVMGDNRLNSSDSRSSAMGCVLEEDILGRVIFRVWPLDRLSVIR